MTYGDTSNWGYPKMTFFYVVWDCLHHDLMVIGRRITLADPPFSGAGIPSECWWEGCPDGSKWAMGELDWSWRSWLISFFFVLTCHGSLFWVTLWVLMPTRLFVGWIPVLGPNALKSGEGTQPTDQVWLCQPKHVVETRQDENASSTTGDSTATGMGARISRHSLLARDSMCDVRHVLFVLDISCGYRIGSNLAASNIY